MNKMKIAGIIISIVAAAVFVFLYFGRPHTGNKCNPGDVGRRRCGAWINDDFGSRRN